MSVFLVCVAVTVTPLRLYTYLVVYSNPSDGNIVQMCWVGQSGLLGRDEMEDCRSDGAEVAPELCQGTSAALQQASPRARCPHLLKLALSELCAALNISSVLGQGRLQYKLFG